MSVEPPSGSSSPLPSSRDSEQKEQPLIPYSAFPRLESGQSLQGRLFRHVQDSSLIEVAQNSGLVQIQDRRLESVLPVPTGPYQIGLTSLVLEDGSRIDPHTADKHRKLGIELFIPTKQTTGTPLTLPFCEGHSLEKDFAEEQKQSLHTHSHSHFTPPDGTQKFPVILFSHGLGFDPVEYRPLLEELTSLGFICISLNHPYNSVAAPFVDKKDAIHELSVDEEAHLQADDIEFTINQLNTSSSIQKILSPYADTNHLFAAGHSLGGAAALIASRNNPHINACINLDGAIRGEDKLSSFPMPLLTIISGKKFEKDALVHDEEEMLKDWESLSANSPLSTTLCVEGVDHEDFTIFPLLEWCAGKKSTVHEALQAHTITTQAMLKFINSNIKQY